MPILEKNDKNEIDITYWQIEGYAPQKLCLISRDGKCTDSIQMIVSNYETL